MPPPDTRADRSPGRHLGAGTLVGFAVTGLSYDWGQTRAVWLAPAGLLAAWGYFAWAPGQRPRDWLYGEALLIAGLLIALTQIAPPGQYAMLAFGRPLVDPALDAADAMLGIHVPDLVTWARPYGTLIRTLLYAYLSLGGQLFLPVAVLGFLSQRRTLLWEYAWHFHVCSLIVLVVLAIWPAEGPPLYYRDFTPLFTFTRYAAQFRAVHAGTLTAIQPELMEGLVSLPSFHVAAALMVVWAFRWSLGWLAILIPLNALLVAATVLSGAHYVADLIAAVAMCGVSLILWRRFGQRWLVPSAYIPA